MTLGEQHHGNAGRYEPWEATRGAADYMTPGEQHHGNADRYEPWEATRGATGASAWCNALPLLTFSEHLRVHLVTSPQASSASADILCREPALHHQGNSTTAKPVT